MGSAFASMGYKPDEYKVSRKKSENKIFYRKLVEREEQRPARRGRQAK